jgi:cytochrome c
MNKRRIALSLYFLVPLLFIFFYQGINAQEEEGETAIKAAISKGKALFHDKKLGAGETTCSSCHLPEAPLTGVADTYPKYSKGLKKVIILEEQINACIVGPLKGKPLRLGSEDANALAAYISSLK